MKTFLLGVASLFLGSIGLSQPTLRIPFNKKISIDDGLSSYNIKKIIQDRYGFIWIATQDGLSRYDGKTFFGYNKSMKPDRQLLGSDIWDMEEDSLRNVLWVVTSYGGLNAIDLKTASVCRAVQAKLSQKGFHHEWLRCLKLLKNDLWIGTYDGVAIYNISTEAFEKFEPLPFKKGQSNTYCIDKIFIDGYENVWLFIANCGIAVYSGKTKKLVGCYTLEKFFLKNESTYKQFNSIVSLSAGRLLVGTSQGFRRIEYDRGGVQSSSAGLYDDDREYSHARIEASGSDTSGHVWFSAPSKLYRADLYSHTVLEVKDAGAQLQNDWFNYIYDIYFDKTNNIWLGTRKGVAYTKNTIPIFHPYYVSEDQSTKMDHVFYLYPCNDSIVYACTETGLLKVNTYENSIISLDMGKKYYFITSHSDKNMLVSTEDSFFVYRPSDKRFLDISSLYPELAPLRKISVNSVVYQGDSLALIGTQTAGGFYTWNYRKGTLKKFHMPETVDAAEAAIVNTLYKDRKGRIWILGNKWITVYDPAGKETNSINLVNRNNRNPHNLFFDVCEAGGYYWIAAYGSGLIQLDQRFAIKAVFTEAEGLCNNGIYKVFPVQDSLLFISTNHGLSVLNLHRRSFTSYYREDGLNSNAFEQSCGIEKNGKLYMGGINGFTIIDPALFTVANTAPKLYLNHIRIETGSRFSDTSNISLTSLRIPKDVLQTTLSFSALNYSNPLRTAYAYKIQDLNNNWIHLGTQNSVSLIGLSPGKHTLLVKSANENGMWNEKPLELSLIYLPKWYQTLGFKILVGLLAAGLLVALYAYRVSQRKKRQKIRKDIAADLHDDIGSILNTVKVFTHLARKEPRKEEHLMQIEESLTQATVAFRDMIWILDDSHDTVYEFVERIRKFITPVSNASGIHITCHAEPELHNEVFSTTEKRNILLIVKESINNSLKYAGCNNIRITIRQVHKKLSIQIEDDGVGFMVDELSKGMGLKNIRYRAGQIGYHAAIISSPGKGTMVQVGKV